MKCILFAAILSCVAAAGCALLIPPRSIPAAQRAADEINLPEMDFHQQDVRVVLKEIERLGKERDPKGRGVPVTYSCPADATPPEITFSGINYSLFRALRMVAMISNSDLLVDRRGFVLRMRTKSR